MARDATAWAVWALRDHRLWSMPWRGRTLASVDAHTGELTTGLPPRRWLRLMARCAASVVALLAHRELHLDRSRAGATYRLPDGRRYRVFRESSSSAAGDGAPVTLAVWFELRWVPAHAP